MRPCILYSELNDFTMRPHYLLINRIWQARLAGQPVDMKDRGPTRVRTPDASSHTDEPVQRFLLHGIVQPKRLWYLSAAFGGRLSGSRDCAGVLHDNVPVATVGPLVDKLAPRLRRQRLQLHLAVDMTVAP